MTNDAQQAVKHQKCIGYNCDHKAYRKWEWAPGHGGGKMCDCCAEKIWKSTLENVTRSLAEMEMRCHE